MGLHVGEPCFYCNQTLTEQDDIVVCPDCGTPYHRSCYQAAGRCTNDGLHAIGGSWAPEVTQEAALHCSNCGAPNDPAATRCQNCGVPLGADAPADPWPSHASEPEEPEDSLRSRIQRTAHQMGLDDPYGALDPEETLDQMRLGDLGDFVHKNVLYYLPRFLRFGRDGRRISLNFPCLLFPHLYFAYRKMLALALVLAGVFAILQIPQTAQTLMLTLPQMIAMFSSGENGQHMAALYPQMVPLLEGMLARLEAHEGLIQNLVSISSYLDLCVSIVFGLLGNWLYYRHARKKTQQVIETGLSAPVRRMRLRQEGGTNLWLILLAMVVEYTVLSGLTMLLIMVLL